MYMTIKMVVVKSGQLLYINRYIMWSIVYSFPCITTVGIIHINTEYRDNSVTPLQSTLYCTATILGH